MIVMLRPNIKINDPQEVILRYYKTMGKGVCSYDQATLPEDNYFPIEQLKEAKRLADKLGTHGIPHSAIGALDEKKSEIRERLREVPTIVSILADYSEIPWDNVRKLLETLRVRGLGIARLTKMLHKKRPNIIPIIDSVMEGYLRPFVSRQAVKGVSDVEKAMCYIKELKKDVDTNRMVLMQLHDWQGKPYRISILRVLDILVWCTQGPFRDRFADLIS